MDGVILRGSGKMQAISKALKGRDFISIHDYSVEEIKLII